MTRALRPFEQSARFIADALAAHPVPARLWAAWMDVWFLTMRIRYGRDRVQRCDCCSEPGLRDRMVQFRTWTTHPAYRCHECNELVALLRECAVGGLHP